MCSFKINIPKNRSIQVCKQLYALTDLGPEDWTDLNILREAMGVMQHHDAITGTEKEHVAEDYARILQKGFDECDFVAATALRYLFLIIRNHFLPLLLFFFGVNALLMYERPAFYYNGVTTKPILANFLNFLKNVCLCYVSVHIVLLSAVDHSDNRAVISNPTTLGFTRLSIKSINHCRSSEFLNERSYHCAIDILICNNKTLLYYIIIKMRSNTKMHLLLIFR